MLSLAKSITDKWWHFVLDGVLAVIFGITAWVWPGATVYTLVVLFGAYSLLGGLFRLITADSARREGQSPWLFAFQGLLGIVAGITVLVWPGMSALALLYVIAISAIFMGTSEIVAAVSLRKVIDNEWFLGLSGVAAIVFGVLALVFPGGGALAIVWAIGLYAIIFGTSLVALGARLHSVGEKLPKATA